MDKNNLSYKKWKKTPGFRYALYGIYKALYLGTNMKIHGIAALLVVILGILLSINSYEWMAVVLSIILVIAAEMINTALELITDQISPGFDKVAGTIKDIAAGAVLIVSIGAIIIGIIVFLPKILSVLN